MAHGKGSMITGGLLVADTKTLQEKIVANHGRLHLFHGA